MLKPLLFTAAALVLAAGVASAQDLSRPDSAFAPRSKAASWQNTVTRTDRGHLVGNPDAGTTLVEFISYTCPHCADFAARGEPALDVVLLGPGKLKVEVRPVIRNGLDVVVTLLANCGDPADFKVRHRALILAQADWLGKARAAPQTQQAIWQRGDRAARQNAAAALGLTAMLAAKGQSKAELDACVANDAAAQKLLANDDADAAEFGVDSTPSFAMDGKLLTEVHSWETLYPLLRERFTARAE
ncbi:DsbA family protein [Porphyrobacter sp. AAP82]|uniref:DsbA family protein n=1 Tax=Porphyrobacter sp. AAP82 TaxID=1248917 RepID=UPI0002F8CD90|nr:thioredoxin domain-containing protein [Porphyrobacter sp. AAP82]